jgi:integrase/recombinase XerD
MLCHMTNKVLDAYLTDCIVRQLAPTTIKSYRFILGQFVKWTGDVPITSVDADTLRQYILELKQGDHNAGGVHLHYRYIRTLLRWWEQETDGEYRSPTRKVKAPKTNREPLEPVPVEHVTALLNTCDRTYLAIRDKALITVMLDTGARARELLNAEIDNVDPTLGTIIILGKGSKTRTLYLGNNARRLLRKWLQVRKGHNYLWATRTGSHFTYDGLVKMLRKRARMAGIPTPKTHAFRRQFALSMLRAGVNTFTLAKLMGHSNTRTLEHYIKLDYHDMAIAHRQNSPGDRL